MIIALTGLHGAGKSHFANLIPPKFGFEVFYKNDIIKNIYNNEESKGDFQNWCREEYDKNLYDIVSKILSSLPSEKDIILDSVHNYDEWETIKSIIPTAMLASVTTPENIRLQRQDKGDDVKDIQRIKYWHNTDGESVDCLLTQVSWSFNGMASLETNERNFIEFLDYIQEQEKGLFEDKDKKLEELIQEDERLSLKLTEAEMLLGRYVNEENDKCK